MVRRRILGVLVVVVFGVGFFAVLGAPEIAQAQDVDPDSPSAPYPGPFDADDEADEVKGETISADQNETSVPGGGSIDHIGDDAASYFVAPDIVASTDAVGTVAAGASGGRGLAATGSDMEPIIAISVGMLAVGGSVLVSSRRRLRDFFK